MRISTKSFSFLIILGVFFIQSDLWNNSFLSENTLLNWSYLDFVIPPRRRARNERTLLSELNWGESLALCVHPSTMEQVKSFCHNSDKSEQPAPPLVFYVRERPRNYAVYVRAWFAQD